VTPRFNTTGPCIPGEHYMLPPERRLRDVVKLIEERRYFTLQRGLDQMARYLDRLALDEGWLVMFDLRKGPAWEERLYMREVEHAGKRIHLVGC
jgi:hypothetical protein